VKVEKELQSKVKRPWIRILLAVIALLVLTYLLYNGFASLYFMRSLIVIVGVVKTSNNLRNCIK